MSSVVRLPTVDLPNFKGKETQEWLARYEGICDQNKLNDEQKIKNLPLYCKALYSERIRDMDEFKNPDAAGNWAKLKARMLTTFIANREHEHTRRELSKYVQKMNRRGGITSVWSLDKYHLKFTQITSSLKRRGAIADEEMCRYYKKGLGKRLLKKYRAIRTVQQVAANAPVKNDKGEVVVVEPVKTAGRQHHAEKDISQIKAVAMQILTDDEDNDEMDTEPEVSSSEGSSADDSDASSSSSSDDESTSSKKKNQRKNKKRSKKSMKAPKVVTVEVPAPLPAPTPAPAPLPAPVVVDQSPALVAAMKEIMEQQTNTLSTTFADLSDQIHHWIQARGDPTACQMQELQQNYAFHHDEDTFEDGE